MKNKVIICLVAIILILVCTFVLISFSGCSREPQRTVDDIRHSSTSLFTVVEVNSELDFYVVYMNDTKVMYTVSRMVAYDGGAGGVFTLLVNPDGSPMLYKEAKYSN